MFYIKNWYDTEDERRIYGNSWFQMGGGIKCTVIASEGFSFLNQNVSLWKGDDDFVP